MLDLGPTWWQLQQADYIVEIVQQNVSLFQMTSTYAGYVVGRIFSLFNSRIYIQTSGHLIRSRATRVTEWY